MKKILVIDDNLTNLRLIKLVLIKDLQDCKVYIAVSGKEGIQIAQEELPEIILLDIIMPGMNGFEVCKALKTYEQTKHIPILLVSALGNNTEDRIRGLDMGADAFLAKPFDRAELISQVNVLLRIKSAEDLLRKRNEDLELFIKKQSKDFTESEDRFLQISEHALEYFWEVDSKGLYTYISSVIEKIVGYKNKEVIGKEFLFDFPNSKDKKQVRELLFTVFSNKQNYEGIEILCLHKNGSNIWLKISGFAIYDKDLKFSGYRGVTNDITIRKQTEEDLKKSLEEIKNYQLKLKKLNLTLALAEEKERRRIAEYLHDGIGQLLSISHIKLSSLISKNLTTDIQKIIRESNEYISDAIVQSRLLTYDLSPPILYELGLIPAIKWKLDQIIKNNKIEANLYGEETVLNLNTDSSILLYRIICELLINVTKHANADKIDIQVSKDSNFYTFAVIDNGKGFDYTSESKYTKKEGYGLFSINERLESIQGSLFIESGTEKGSVATVRIPIKKN